jgi:hypothetical protein
MYQTVLVNDDLENGRRILERLQQGRMVDITAAFWFHFAEEDQWKLVIVSPDVADKGPKVLYTMLSTVLYDLANDPKAPFEFPLDRLMLVSPYSLLFKMVKQRVGLRVGPAREGLALDAYIYKMD